MSEEPNTTGDKRDEKGRFIKGIAPNPNGRPRGSGISITTRIKQELEKCPEGEDKKTYLELLVRRILKKAIVDGDQIMIKSIWNYIDGMPRESVDLTSKGKRIGLFDYENRENNSDFKIEENEKEDPSSSRGNFRE